MPRGSTQRVLNAKKNLRKRLLEGGDLLSRRALSNRSVAEEFSISYQTAHRILTELSEEGILNRRAASGTYPALSRQRLDRVVLVFHSRSRRQRSFGHNLISQLEVKLSREGIESGRVFQDPNRIVKIPEGVYPVFWEARASLRAFLSLGRHGLLVHDKLDTSEHIDQIDVDDFRGGAMAAGLLKSELPDARRILAIAGPPVDQRSRRRIEGFRSVLPAVRVLFACGWYREDGLAIARDAYRQKPDGVFCCNDRLAEAMVIEARSGRFKLPHLVGFDDAPVAREQAFSTIALPWSELTDQIVEVVRRRIAGERFPVVRRTLMPFPVDRFE